MENTHFQQLNALGAGEFTHLNGTLVAHLTSTWHLLKAWQGSDVLCTAGLYHAAYGTDGFSHQMVSLTQRTAIANVIGEEAEALVYLYCSCDRAYTFSRLDTEQPIQFKDRFSHETCQLTAAQARDFCELTAANELELCIDSHHFKQQYGTDIRTLLHKMQNHLSDHAKHQLQQVLP